MRTVPVMSLLVFFGTLVASLPHSGFVLALGCRSPRVFLARLFLTFCDTVEVTEGWLASNGCSRSLPLSPETLHAQLTLVATVTNGPVSLCCCHVSCHVTSRHVRSAALFLALPHSANVSLARVVMATWNADDTDSPSDSDSESSVCSSADPWGQRQPQLVNNYRVSLRRELDVSTSEANRQRAFLNRRQAFLSDYDWQDADGPQ